MTSITIPNSVTSIGGEAFYWCSRLRDVYCYATEPPIAFYLDDYYMGYYYSFDLSYIKNHTTLHVPESSLDAYSTTEPWSEFGTIVALPPTYNLTYIIDGEVYKTYEEEEGSAITPEPAPTKEGYTFSGWSYIPPTMPATDVVVIGTFKINTYTLTYEVDGEEYKSYDVEYNAAITPEPAPTKAGYTFSGWSEIPETMPAHDVTVTGSFTKDKLGKCATPTISYSYGKLTFNSETEGVTFNYDIDIVDNDVKSGSSNIVQLAVTYHISVYAQKEDYYDSEVVRATLCWIDVEPATEGTPIAIYDTSGKQYSSATSEKDRTTISTSLQPGTIAIVKIGEKSIKVVIK